MVAQHQQPQLQPQPHQQPPPSSSQDEALKRNTDCVYFLASPLTCKKGNECEYRHSEYARVNPRDCWYWLNGNCLNPKCSFRHPPLDGLLGTQSTTAASGPSVPPTQTVTTSAPTHYNANKQAVPCIFFQKGLCLKGDRCAFSHGPNPNPKTGNRATTQVPVTNQGGDNSNLKKPFGGAEKFTQERKPSQGNVARPAGVPETKPAPKVEIAPQKNMFGLEKRAPQPSVGFDNEAARFKRPTSPSVTNGPTVARSNRLHPARVPDDHNNFHGGKDSDEFLRESSPGFDVLVADERRSSDYYHGEDEFGNARGHDERNLDSLNEYDLGHSADYGLVADIDRERFRAAQGYDHMQEPYSREQHRRAPVHLERRTRRRSDSPENVQVSDLRYRLSKRRKGDGLKSVVANDYALESHGEERNHRLSSRKDSHQLPLNESSLSNRFRGRIKLPANGGDNRLEREDRGRLRGRFSSERLQGPHQGRIQDRIRGRLQDDERRNYRDRSMGRELSSDRGDFAGPKSLAELKNGRNTENKEWHQSLGKRTSLRDHQQSEDDFLFEGPKPLSEILKEKKGIVAGAASESDKSSDKKNREMTNSADHAPAANAQNGALSEKKEDVNEEESKFQDTDTAGRDATENADVTHGQSSEDGMIYDEAAEDQEYEGDEDQREGDYDYLQVDEEGEYEYEQGEEGENQDQEYMEDEDGDDFAKKIGVILTQ